MYIVTISNNGIETPIHNEREKLHSGKVVKGINTIDSFTFSILPSNAGFDLINEFTTLVTVYNTNKKIYDFIGRVLYPETTMDEGGLITKEVTCESIFGYLCDSQQAYVDTKNWTVRGLLQHLIDCHNSQVEEYKRFRIGEVTATDANDNLYLGIQRANTWDAINEKLIKQIGGELRYRVEGGVIYIDYLEQLGETRSTAIELSVNMKSITREKDPTAYVTRLIPLGAKLSEDTEERLDISSVNDGKNYIDDETAIAVYGIHVGYVEFDDVTTASNLFNKGTAWMVENNKVQIKYSITALDLSLIGLAIDDLDVCDYHPIKNALLGIDDIARIIKKTIDICEEVKSTIEMGDNFKTLSDIQQEQAEQAAQNIQKMQATQSALQTEVSNTKNSVSNLETKVNGINGTFFFIRYSAYSDGHIMTETPQEDTLYMGTCSTSQEIAPTDSSKYTWCRVKGEPGKDGTSGTSGQRGHGILKVTTAPTSYTTSTGGKNPIKRMSLSTIKTQAKVDEVLVGDQISYSYYLYNIYYVDATYAYMDTYTSIRGATGSAGAAGADGRTSYLHIKYSDDGETFTANNGEELGAWIGTLVDFTEADSTTFSDYTWKKFTEDVDEELEAIRQTVIETQTSIITECNNIILQALKSYVETSNYEEFKQTLQTQLSVMADQILMNFKTVTEQITNVDGDMQSKFTELYEWIRIAGGVMTFGSSSSAITLSLENDNIVFRKNGVQFGSWDGENFYTGNIVIRLGERFQLGEFAYKPRLDKSMMLVWVGA